MKNEKGSFVEVIEEETVSYSDDSLFNITKIAFSVKYLSKIF